MVSRNPQYWRSDQFNLICYENLDEPIFKNIAGRAEFDSDNMFWFTAREIRENYQSDISKLAYLPTIVVAKLANASFTKSFVPARFTRISDVHKEGNGNIVFEYRHLDGNVTSEDVFKSEMLPPTFRSRIEAKVVHWAVKNGDLIGWIFDRRKEQDALAKPRFFETDVWPMPKRQDIGIMMPFSKEFDPVHEAIKSVCDSMEVSHLRVDEIYRPSKIADDILVTIAQSKLVICDLTGRNPNVLYETGLAHALNVKVIMLTQNAEDIPFDLDHIRYFTYLNNGEGLQQLQKKLQLIISECLAG